MMQMEIVTILALVAGVFSIIELGMTAHLSSSDTPSQISFMIFNSVWSILILAYIVLTPMYMAQFYNKMVSLALNAITMLFWFAGSIALAVLFRHTSDGTAKAAVVFGFLLWLIFSATTIIDALDWSKTRNSSGASGLKGPHAYPGA